MNKKQVLLLCGGRSTEHAVSLKSAKNVYEVISQSKYDVSISVIDEGGLWFVLTEREFLDIVEKGKLSSGKRKYTECVCAPGMGSDMRLIERATGKVLKKIDVVFPVLHGKFGEDGTLQGMLEMMGVAYVGSGVLGSALGMDKAMAKQVLSATGIEVAPWRVVQKGDPQKNIFRECKKEFGLPLFVKPSRAGSSVGVSKVCNEREFCSAMRTAFLYDDMVLVEEMIVGREIECAVMGNTFHPEVSGVGEIVVFGTHGFYSYEAKYIDSEGSRVEIPAKISPKVAMRVRELAVATYGALRCDGLARVDFFVTLRGKVYVNEVNTLPGFTDISMYPKLWEQEYMRGGKLVDTLLRHALLRKKREDALRSRYEEA